MPIHPSANSAPGHPEQLGHSEFLRRLQFVRGAPSALKQAAASGNTAEFVRQWFLQLGHRIDSRSPGLPERAFDWIAVQSGLASAWRSRSGRRPRRPVIGGHSQARSPLPAIARLEPGDGDGDTVALAAHLDTVFPLETDVTVRRRGNRLYAPGVGDDTRGLVLVLNVARALIQAGVRTAGDVVFVGTVGEEGVGDLRGVRYLFANEGPGIDQFIAVDGGDDSRVVNQAIGSRRYRVTVTGPGGHSWGDFGLGNPAHALGRAMYYFDEAATVLVNDAVPTSYNVGRIGGGTSVNAVPQETWAEIDLRSVDPVQLDRLEDTLFSAVERALADQNRRRDRGPALESHLTLIGERPSGSVDASTGLVQRALAVTRHLGLSPRFGAGSTDANVPIARGVPAVTIGRGGTGGGAHSLDEWWAPSLPNVAVQRALLLLVASAGVID